VEDYKSLCAAVTILPPWLTSRQTHTHTHDRHTDSILISLYDKKLTRR